MQLCDVYSYFCNHGNAKLRISKNHLNTDIFEKRGLLHRHVTLLRRNATLNEFEVLHR
ncbi:hypothetical protein M758_11G052000 [Ceratodon purpureus]|nr:hypothetical protein M758_11G052000 [Ceratodon purpureus]